jgi:hypothetical protein
MTASDVDRQRFAALVAPLTPESFRAQVWPAQVFHGQADPARLDELLGDPAIADVRALVETPRRGYLRVDRTRGGDGSEYQVQAERALELYAEGRTLYLTALASPVAQDWSGTLDRVLGLLPGTAIINAFASLPGPGLPWHWDCQELFIVQVRGRKRWHLAANDYVDWPSVNGSVGSERDHLLRAELRDPARPIVAPTATQSIELSPGSVLFVPRGTWHTVENVEESLHLVLQTQLPSWRDVFQFLLQHAPMLHALPWRKPSGALAPAHLMDAGVRELRERLAELSGLAEPAALAAMAALFGQMGTASGLAHGPY